MTVTSMTGFARVDGMEAGYRWVWEVKSVNSKGPLGIDAFDFPDPPVSGFHAVHAGKPRHARYRHRTLVYLSSPARRFIIFNPESRQDVPVIQRVGD